MYNILCAGNKAFATYQAQGGLSPLRTPLGQGSCTDNMMVFSFQWTKFFWSRIQSHLCCRPLGLGPEHVKENKLIFLKFDCFPVLSSTSF